MRFTTLKLLEIANLVFVIVLLFCGKPDLAAVCGIAAIYAHIRSEEET